MNDATTKAHTSPIAYRADIDALRTIAVGLVILHHAFPRIAPAGFIGVDMFFVISGYLITGIIVRQRERGSFSFRGFYDRRIRRIFPAALAVLFTALALGWLVLFAPELKQLGQHALSSSTFTQNVRLRKEIGYFDEAAIFKPLLHFWSLSIEEQFYLVWPLLIGLLAARRRRLLAGVSILLVSSLAYALWQATRLPDAVYYDTFARVWQLASGGLLHIATQYRTLPAPRPAIRRAGAFAALVVMMGSGLIPVVAGPFPSLNAMLAVVGAVVWIYVAPQAPLLGPLAQIGKISYSLYLWHWLILSFGRIYTGAPLDLRGTLIALLLTGILSLITYRYVESIRYRRWRGTTAALVIAMVACALTGYTLARRDGLPDRPQLAYLEDYKLQLTRTPHDDPVCRTYARRLLSHPGTFYYCRATDDVLDPARKKIAIIGDSHAHVLFPGMAEQAQKHGYATVMLGNSSCPPLPGFLWGNTEQRRSKCQQSIEEIYRVLERDPAIEVVLLTTRGPVYIHGEPEVPFTPASVARGLDTYVEPEYMTWEAFYRGLLSGIRRLAALPHVRTIACLLENPELDFLPKDVVPRPFDKWGISLQSSHVSRDLYERRMRVYRKIVAQVQRQVPQLLILDPANVLCDEQDCTAFRDGRFLYADDDHFSVYGSSVIARAFSSALFTTQPGQVRTAVPDDR